MQRYDNFLSELDVWMASHIVPRQQLIPKFANLTVIRLIMKMPFRKNTLILLAAQVMILSFYGCNNEDPNDLHAYYFPYESYKNGVVLEYRPDKIAELGNEYWYMKSFTDSGRQYLITQIFDDQLRFQQYILEEYVSNGILARELRMLRRTDDTSAMLLIDIEQNGVFPLTFKDSLTRYIYEISWQDPIDSLEYQLIRNRRLTHREDRMFLGKLRPAWHTEILEELKTTSEGSTLSSWSGEEWYAKDIGLVYFSKQITAQFERSYYLHKIHAWEDFEERIGPALVQPEMDN